MWWIGGQGLKMPRGTNPADRKLRSFVHEMTTLDKRVLFVDGKEQTVDLQQPSQSTGSSKNCQNLFAALLRMPRRMRPVQMIQGSGILNLNFNSP
jgi:hypothetical protein